MTCIAEKACRLEGDDGYLLLQTLAASSISFPEAQAKKSRSTSKHICFFFGEGAGRTYAHSRHHKGSGGFRSTTMLQSARLHCTLRTARSKWSQCRMIVYNVALLEPNVSCAGAHGLYTRPCAPCGQPVTRSAYNFVVRKVIRCNAPEAHRAITQFITATFEITSILHPPESATR